MYDRSGVYRIDYQNQLPLQNYVQFWVPILHGDVYSLEAHKSDMVYTYV